MSFLATTSSLLDHYLRSVNAGFAIGFTSVLIIVSTKIYHFLIILQSLKNAMTLVIPPHTQF